MATKFSPDFALPTGFSETLKNFTREVLRDQPEDIYRYGQQYFQALVREAQRGDPGAAGVGAGADAQAAGMVSSAASRLGEQELFAKIESLFLSADRDGNGTLDHKEFKALFASLSAELGLRTQDIRRIMAEADEDDSGTISWQEFVPVAVDVIQSIYAKLDFEAEVAQREEEALDDARECLLHGMPREELNAMLYDVFRKSDVDGNGSLSRGEFQRSIRAADLGLTRHEINLLMSEVDADHDGRITYEEFVPCAFNLLAQIVSAQLVKVPKEEGALAKYFADMFARHDVEGAGKLSTQQLCNIIKRADLGFTRVQLHAIMSEAAEDDQGLVEYEGFAATIASMALLLLDYELQQSMAGDVYRIREMAEYHVVHGMNRETFDASLQAAFVEADAGGAGALSRAAIREVLQGALPDVSAKQMQALMSLAEPDTPDGLVLYEKVVQWAFPTLQWLNEQLMLRS